MIFFLIKKRRNFQAIILLSVPSTVILPPIGSARHVDKKKFFTLQSHILSLKNWKKFKLPTFLKFRGCKKCYNFFVRQTASKGLHKHFSSQLNFLDFKNEVKVEKIFYLKKKRIFEKYKMVQVSKSYFVTQNLKKNSTIFFLKFRGTKDFLIFSKTNHFYGC